MFFFAFLQKQGKTESCLSRTYGSVFINLLKTEAEYLNFKIDNRTCCLRRMKSSKLRPCVTNFFVGALSKRLCKLTIKMKRLTINKQFLTKICGNNEL